MSDLMEKNDSEVNQSVAATANQSVAATAEHRPEPTVLSMARGAACNQTELASILGVSDVTLWEWQKLGMPILHRGARGQENQYDTAAVIIWKIEHEVNKVRGGESPKDRLARLQSEKVLRELQQMDKILIPASQLEPALFAMTNSIGKGLDAMEHKLCSALQATHGQDADVSWVKEEIDDVRAKWQPDILDRITSGVGEDDAAGDGTAEAKVENFVG